MVKAGRNGFKFIGWGLLLIVLFTGYLISFFEDLNTFFLSLLISEIVLVFIYIRRFYGLQITLARIILGCVFIYSGLVKGIDPVGTEYRIVDYFIAFGMDWANPLALPLSVILNATEFILGVLLVFNINIKITSWLVISMMAVFTVVTINDAVYNPVPDCGCFGDALVITNWQTLYKNLIIN
ncbi:MAG: DoxX family membrane protein, partial [Bacteroidales bacterium]|nr:DoxX family membrane protein [Bacteroidales bacterium]